MEQEIGSEEQTEARRREKEQGHKARSAMRSQKADSPERDDSGDKTGSQIGHWVSSSRQDAEHATFLLCSCEMHATVTVTSMSTSDFIFYCSMFLAPFV